MIGTTTEVPLDEPGVGREQLDPSAARTYAQTVARGLYGRDRRGLAGKHDNVRTNWEDEVTRNVLRPLLREQMLACRAANGRRLRVLDLGCGAGQGYELLTQIRCHDLTLEELPGHVIEPVDLDYMGVDLSPSMVRQGWANYRGIPCVRFEEADLREDLGPAGSQSAFDVYLSSYGALSHLTAPQLAARLAQIVLHAQPGALVVLDLLGRFSLEWPAYWHATHELEKTRLYSMSYLFPEEERSRGEIETFPLRFWTGAEVRALCHSVSGETRRSLQVCELFDRSIFVGRHVDTAEYRCPLPPLRRLVNSLYEHNVRTPLARLEIGYRPIPDAGFLNEVFGRLGRCWDTVVNFAQARLMGKRIDMVDIPGWRDSPAALQMALLTLDRVIDSVGWIDVGDARANIIEPQLAYILQRMLHLLQEGQGCGHGLVAVLRVAGQRQS